MTKHIELKRFNQGTALTTGTLALPSLVIEGLAEFNGSFDRLCLKARRFNGPPSPNKPWDFGADCARPSRDGKLPVTMLPGSSVPMIALTK